MKKDISTKREEELTLSPSVSGKSFVMAITVANVVMNLAIKDTFGDHLNGAPIASFTAKYTPKFSKNPRTVAIVSPARIGFFFVLKGGTE